MTSAPPELDFLLTQIAEARSLAGSSFDGVFASLTGKPTTIGGYGITDFNSLGDARWQPLDGDLSAMAALATDSFGRALLTKIDGADVRSYIGAGNSSFDGTFAALTGKPTTISGYGIADAFTQVDADALYSVLAHVHTFASLTSKPTTLLGYGITDAQPLDADLTALAALATDAFGLALLTKTDAASIRTYIGAGTSSFDQAAADALYSVLAHVHTFASLTSKPTTLLGYGIADAQPLDSDLTAIAALTATTDNFIVSVASAWASRTPAQVKTTLSLNNVDNTTDAGKPVSTAQQTALNLKANLVSPSFTTPVLGAATGTSLEMTGFNTSNSQFKVGSFEFQSYALSNSWLGDNVYYNGSDFKNRATGAVSMFYFSNGRLEIRNYASAAAGTTLAQTTTLHVSPTGFGVGAAMANGVFTGARFYVDYATAASELLYDASNKLTTTIGPTGGVTFDALGSGAKFTFSDPVVLSGGMTVPISIKTTAYTVAASDYYIVGNHATVAFTITMIAASSNTGKMFKFKNKGAAAVTIDATGLGQIYTNALVNTRVLANGDAITLTSDGATWVLE